MRGYALGYVALATWVTSACGRIGYDPHDVVDAGIDGADARADVEVDTGRDDVGLDASTDAIRDATDADDATDAAADADSDANDADAAPCLTDEICNGRDDDCDTRIDEEYLGSSTNPLVLVEDAAGVIADQELRWSEPRGEFLAMYRTITPPGVYMVLAHADGTTVGPRFVTAQAHFDIAWNGDVPTAIYNESIAGELTVQYARIDPASLTPFTIRLDTPGGETAGAVATAVLDVGGVRRVGVAWTEGVETWSTVFEGGSELAGARQLLSTRNATPDIEMTATSDGFFVAWLTTTDIAGRPLSATGTPTLAEQIVSSTRPGTGLNDLEHDAVSNRLGVTYGEDPTSGGFFTLDATGTDRRVGLAPTDTTTVYVLLAAPDTGVFAVTPRYTDLFLLDPNDPGAGGATRTLPVGGQYEDLVAMPRDVYALATKEAPGTRLTVRLTNCVPP